MFGDEVHVEKKNDLRYGTTRKPAHETLNEIIELLREGDCERIITDQEEDNMRIGFVFEGKSYIIQIPKVYVKGKYKPKIGPRVVYHFLEIVLSWTKTGIISMNKALMSNRIVELDDKRVQLGEALENLPASDLMAGLKTESLPEKEEDEDVIEADYEVVED